MNAYDSDRMLDALAQKGFKQTGNQNDADLIILNTCHIRDRATQKVYSELGKLRILKNERVQSGHSLQIAVAGCIAQAEGKEIITRQPAVDMVVGPQSYHKIGEMIDQSAAATRLVETEFPIESKFDHLPLPAGHRLHARGASAFVTIQEGCDKFCTFCVVPYTRGAETSRPVASVVDEVRRLASGGIREVTLIGQNVNAYNGRTANNEKSTLAELLATVGKVPGIDRLRYTTSHPREMHDDLIQMHGTNKKLMPYLHLPVQSGSDRILEQMNRQHTAQDYIAIIGSVRAQRKDIAISSDFIVGFPGESEEDFQQTMNLVEEVQFASAYSFKYSSRPGTTGSEMEDDVPADVKSWRLRELQELLDRQRNAFNESCVGKTVDVLFEKPGRYPGQVTGKTPHLQTVQVEAGRDLIGNIVPVELIEAGPNSLFGRKAV